MAHRFTVNISDELYEAMQILKKRNRYRSDSEIVCALIRYDAQCQKEHYLTIAWAAMTPAERDLLDKALLKQVKSGAGIRSSWIDSKIKEAAKNHIKSHGTEPTTHDIGAQLAKDIVEQAKGLK